MCHTMEFGSRLASFARSANAFYPCSMLGGLLFSVMDTTIVSTALVTIAYQLDDFQNMYWVVLAYLLSYLGKRPCLLQTSYSHGDACPLTESLQVVRSVSPRWQTTSAAFLSSSSHG